MLPTVFVVDYSPREETSKGAGEQHFLLAPSEDSDQPANAGSLIIVFAAKDPDGQERL